jgi:hypothetical protein
MIFRKKEIKKILVWFHDPPGGSGDFYVNHMIERGDTFPETPPPCTLPVTVSFEVTVETLR